jgi:hypothetical protein
VQDASAEALLVRQKSIIRMDGYTAEAYPCVVAETYATASQDL